MNTFIVPIIIGGTAVAFLLTFIIIEFVRLARSGEGFLQ